MMFESLPDTTISAFSATSLDVGLKAILSPTALKRLMFDSSSPTAIHSSLLSQIGLFSRG